MVKNELGLVVPKLPFKTMTVVEGQNVRIMAKVPEATLPLQFTAHREVLPEDGEMDGLPASWVYYQDSWAPGYEGFINVGPNSAVRTEGKLVPMHATISCRKDDKWISTYNYPLGYSIEVLQKFWGAGSVTTSVDGDVNKNVGDYLLLKSDVKTTHPDRTVTKIRWFKNYELVSEEPDLRFEHLELSDAGIYTVIVSDSSGNNWTADKHVNLKITV